jgi:hypothetical protein
MNSTNPPPARPTALNGAPNLTDAERLRELACWYRELAERTANPTIWDARLRTAEDLETEAARLEGAAVLSEVCACG